MANHVLYFWHQPVAEMGHIHDCLRPGGLIALVHPLRHNMPPMAQKRFPQDGHLLYGSDDELTRTAASSPSITW
jgi:SAM-dependent methyltransferase